MHVCHVLVIGVPEGGGEGVMWGLRFMTYGDPTLGQNVEKVRGGWEQRLSFSWIDGT